mmetsp:Transcript_57541/g.130386  ORF Transcript_57541/g.130386 Transcript_57541/m.130386 type:complete len:364 (+) Transcript_57541:61-1152(+)
MSALQKPKELNGNVETQGAALKTESCFLFREEITDTLRSETELLSITYNAQSQFQKVQVIETSAFGKTLVLDGKTQSAQIDEFIYHESLVQVPMLAVGFSLGDRADPGATGAKRAYIGGGGELATAREILKHPSIEEVVMVDLDEVVVETSRTQLPEWGQGCLDDPRLKVFYEDANAWLDRPDSATGTFDLIVMDICDPDEAGPGIVLYTKEFYELALTKLRPGGVLVTQSGPAGHLNCKIVFTTVHHTLKQVFKHVVPYSSEVPSFGSKWGFTLAFNAPPGPPAGSTSGTAVPSLSAEAFASLSSAEVDARLKARLKNPDEQLKYYDGICHRGCFGLGKQIRKALAEEGRVISKTNPVFGDE